MENQSNYIKLIEEEEPPATEFLQNYWKTIEELPDSLQFLRGHRIESLSSNKSYLLARFTKLNEKDVVAKIDLDAFDIEFCGKPFSLTEREFQVLSNLKNLEISPKLISFHESVDEQFPSVLLTSLEGIGNNLHEQPVQEWWEEYKDDLIKNLCKLHGEDAQSGLSKGFDIKDWFNDFIFGEENIAEFLLEPHTTEDMFDFLDKLKLVCNNIIDELDENNFVLCHNNLCKSSVLHNPNTESKFKFINFHKSIIGPPELDIHSVYHRLGLEDYNTRSGGVVNTLSDLERLYFKYSGYKPSFSNDFRFLNTVQRIMALLFENNMPPMVLYQSNLNLKYAKRKTEFSFLKRRLYSIIIDKSFSYHNNFSDYALGKKMPFTDLILYG